MCTDQTSVDQDGFGQDEPPPQTSRRNYLLGVASGAAGMLSEDFLHPELILAGLAYALTESKLMVALITVINKAGVLAPQLLVGPRLEHRPRKRSSFVALGAARSLALAGMVAALWRLSVQADSAGMALFLLAYLAACACGGAGHVVFMDMTARMIPTGRLGSYFGMRHFLGGMLSVGLGIAVIQPVLAKVELPASYLVLAVIGGALAVANLALFAMCREQAGPSAPNRTTVGESLRRGMNWLRTDRNYRAFFFQRIAFRVNYLGLAFFIPYGSERLTREDSAAAVAVLGGILVATFKLSRTVASVVWGRLADRRGYRSCLLGSGAIFVLAPALALLAPQMPRAFALRIPAVQTPFDLPMVTYLHALAALGAAIQGLVIGGNRFLLINAPPHRRISYVGFLNTITSPLTLLPLAGAWLAAKAGTATLFAITMAGGLAHLLAAARMTPEGNPNAPRPAGHARQS